MVTFLGILFGLLAINALLLLFSVNDGIGFFKKNGKKNVKTPVTKLFPSESSSTAYKKAV